MESKPRTSYSTSKSIVSLLPSPCSATALSAARRLDTIDLEMELPSPHLFLIRGWQILKK